VTRAKISQYSATANDNTDVNGINIAENCPPSSMNNMGREIMAALKRFQVGSDGDGVTVGGALVVSGATTANTLSATNVTASGTITTAAGTASAPAIVPTGDTNTGIFFPAADTIAFAEGGAEAMRIDSSGNVGIGLTSPAEKLHVSGNLALGSNGEISNNAGEKIIFQNSDDSMRFQVSSVERIRINTTGNVQLSGNLGLGGTSPSSSGTGITFPATQSASTDANTLDDYEEGTFTPTISGSTSAGAGSYDVQQGTYTKIGNLVTLNVRMAWSAHTGTGNLEFTNYPFTSINTTNYRASGTFGAFSNIALTANNVALFLMVPNENKSIVSQYPVGGGAPSNVPMDTAGSVHFAITYQTS
jgi:hypothetical protein